MEDNIENIFFAIYFLEEMRKPKDDRQFKEYIDLFPSTIDNFPIFFNDKELVYLKGSQF